MDKYMKMYGYLALSMAQETYKARIGTLSRLAIAQEIVEILFGCSIFKILFSLRISKQIKNVWVMSRI
jgi:hypothetical protein